MNLMQGSEAGLCLFARVERKIVTEGKCVRRVMDPHEVRAARTNDFTEVVGDDVDYEHKADGAAKERS